MMDLYYFDHKIRVTETFAAFPRAGLSKGHQKAARAPDVHFGHAGFGPPGSQSALRRSAREWLCCLQHQNRNMGMKN